jgi:hypothetical protein
VSPLPALRLKKSLQTIPLSAMLVGRGSLNLWRCTLLSTLTPVER